MWLFCVPRPSSHYDETYFGVFFFFVVGCLIFLAVTLKLDWASGFSFAPAWAIFFAVVTSFPVDPKSLRGIPLFFFLSFQERCLELDAAHSAANLTPPHTRPMGARQA